jgi:uncharacterized protein DUF4062/iSTAND domain-containing protein
MIEGNRNRAATIEACLMARVYISSTYIDLIDYRQEAARTLRRMQQEVATMEDYAASDERPLVKCLADVEKCDFYIGIFARRYGFIPPNRNGDNPERKSITELEYRHAVKTGKKCFIFLVDGKSRWSLEHIEDGEGAVKLKALCEELKLNHSVAFFESEEELANEINMAIFPYVANVTVPKLKKLPPFAHKMCDRRSQVNQFANFFMTNLTERPGKPQICFVHGEEGECHDSLVKRLIITQIKAAADDPEGLFKGVATDKSPGWIEQGGELAELQQELKRMLFSQFDMNYKSMDLSATALSKLAQKSLTRLIVFKHTISALRCDEATWRLIEWYLSYWAAMEVEISRPQFVIFFNIIYPKAEPAVWYKPWTLAGKFSKEPIKKSLLEISSNRNSGLPCLLLKEVTPLGQKEVQDWFSEYEDKGGFSLQIQRDSLRSLFTDNQDQKSMIEVEIALERLVEGA